MLLNMVFFKWCGSYSLYRRETLNNLSFLNHGDENVPNCVMATLKSADGQEVGK